MAVGVVISFCGAKSRTVRDDRPRTRSEDRPGHPPRHKPGHAGLVDAPPASLRAEQRKSRGGENFPLRKALKTHETGKSLGSDRQRGASPRETLRRRPEIRAALSVSSCTGLSRASRADVRRIIIDGAAWMPGSRPGMTGWRRDLVVLGRLLRWPQASANARPA